MARFSLGCRLQVEVLIEPEAAQFTPGDLAQSESNLPEKLICAVELWKLNFLIQW
jgi:hypothetical protein